LRVQYGLLFIDPSPDGLLDDNGVHKVSNGGLGPGCTVTAFQVRCVESDSGETKLIFSLVKQFYFNSLKVHEDFIVMNPGNSIWYERISRADAQTSYNRWLPVLQNFYYTHLKLSNFLKRKAPLRSHN